MAEAEPALTERQLRFCEEYASDPNASKAYRRAFGNCSYNTARTEGPKLLANPAIRAEIAAARAEYRRRVRVDATRVLRWLAEIASADPDDLYEPDDTNHGLPAPRPWRSIPPAARRTIASVKVKRRRLKGGGDEVWEVEELEYKTHSKDAAIDKLCRNLGLTRGEFEEAVDKMLKVIDLSGKDDGAEAPPGG